MRKFDTKVQHLKYKVLREVARLAFEDKLLDCYTEIPKMIVKGPEPTMRCCIYKERAIVGERITYGASAATRRTPTSSRSSTSPATSARSAATTVTESCRGCIAHRCEDVCKRGAISFDKHQRAVIDKEKCVECGACAKVCPYSAITDHKRPCENACKVKAISRDEKTLAASIDNDKCIACGACVYQCPFGAITDKSYILDVVESHQGQRRQHELPGSTPSSRPRSPASSPTPSWGRSSPASSGWASTMWSKRRSARTWSPTPRPRN